MAMPTDSVLRGGPFSMLHEGKEYVPKAILKKKALRRYEEMKKRSFGEQEDMVRGLDGFTLKSFR